MTQYSEIKRIDSNSMWRGFGNLLSKENRLWWGGRLWWLRPLLWIIIIDGILAAVLFAAPAAVQADPQQSLEDFDFLSMAIQVLFQLGPIFLAAGAIVMAQGLFSGERESGVAEWILTKPVTRTAYLFSKMLACLVSALVFLVVIPYGIGYLMLSAKYASGLAFLTYAKCIFGLGLYVLFYVTLTSMAALLVNTRGQLLGISLGMLFAGLVVPGFLGQVAIYTPWILTSVLPAMGIGAPLPFSASIPFVATAAWSLLFILIALWRINKIEY